MFIQRIYDINTFIHTNLCDLQSNNKHIEDFWSRVKCNPKHFRMKTKNLKFYVSLEFCVVMPKGAKAF